MRQTIRVGPSVRRLYDSQAVQVALRAGRVDQQVQGIKISGLHSDNTYVSREHEGFAQLLHNSRRYSVLSYPQGFKVAMRPGDPGAPGCNYRPNVQQRLSEGVRATYERDP